jgi:hypothetical protein
MPKPAPKVICPACGHKISKVLDSRGDVRLRECDACQCCWETVEGFLRLRRPGSRQLAHNRSAA